MQQFRVILQGPGSLSDGAAPRRPRSARHNREFRAFFAEPQGLPSCPPTVSLIGASSPLARPAPPAGFELDFFAAPTGWPRRVGNGASSLAVLFVAASVLTPRGAHAAPGHAPPPHVRLDAAGPAPAGPPVRMLSSERRSPAGLSPLQDASGHAARLASFHTNTSPYHQNTPGVPTHTNAWHNHANIITPHSNNWMNHSNIAPGTIPHTNVVPGDFIF